nr:uncharacterized protein LOC120963971 [Aegilops tauschii subsp. strangulata]
MLIRRVLPCQRRTCHLWEYDPAKHQPLQELFGMTHEDIWRVLFKAGEMPPPMTEDRGLSLKRQANSAWIKVAEEINCPAPLPEDQGFPLLEKMLFPAPYEVPEKAAKKVAKGVKKGPRRKSTPDVMSGRETSSSSADDDNGEEEENDSPPDVGRKKRAAPTSPGVKTPKRVRGSLVDNSVWDVDSSPERPRRTKPQAAS